MLILTQNKREIVNLNTIANIYIVSGSIWVNNGGFDPISCIGDYETDERCEEILREILWRYTDCNADKYIRNEVYRMPLCEEE